MARRGELGTPDDRLTSGGGQVFGDGVLPGGRQALYQDGEDEDQAGDGGDGARGAADQGGEPKGELAEHGQEETGADHGPEHSWIPDVGLDAFRRQDGLPGEERRE